MNPLPQRILVAPLNWGLGHAARCIPIIRALLKKKHFVYLGSDGYALELLKKEFPTCPTINLPSYQIKYPTANYSWYWIKKLPVLLKTIKSEHARTKEIAKEYNIDTIISDNRYGVHHPDLRSIFITHQLNLPVSQPQKQLINPLIRKQIERHFNECWIPDTKGPDNLSGSLSEPQLSIPKHFIGPVSRFSKKEAPLIYDMAIVLSGPEPHRTALQDTLIKVTEGSGMRSVMVLGRPDVKIDCAHIKILPFCESRSLNQLLNQSAFVLSRSGYTSIMDYYKLNKKAILIPTPGQPEQIYLAQRLNHRVGFITINHPESEILGAIRQIQRMKSNKKSTFQALPSLLSSMGF